MHERSHPLFFCALLGAGTQLTAQGRQRFLLIVPPLTTYYTCPALPAEAKPTADCTSTTLPAKHKPPRILNARPVACSACLLPLKHRPAANKSSRLDCVKERGISIEGQSLSRKCGNLSFGLLRLFFRVLPIFSQPTSSASVSLLSGLPICIAAPFPRRSSKAASRSGVALSS